MNQVKLIAWNIIILFLAIGNGCKSIDGEIQSDQSYPIETTKASSMIEAYPITAIPSPELQVDDLEPLIIPVPNADDGVVTGILLSSEPDEMPYLTTLYLGETIYADGKEESLPIISFSESESLVGIQDEQTGQFVFSDVPPGEYALIIWTPVFSLVLRDPETNKDVLFMVAPGEITDLGVLKIP